MKKPTRANPNKLMVVNVKVSGRQKKLLKEWAVINTRGNVSGYILTTCLPKTKKGTFIRPHKK